MSSGLGGVMNSVMAGFAMWIPDEDRGPLYTGRYAWSYQLRGASKWALQNFHTSLWPSSAMLGGDASAPLCTSSGGTPPQSGDYEDWQGYYNGTWRPYFLNGQTQLVGGTPAASTVRAFLTATDVEVSAPVGTDASGNYAIPTNFIGQNHYCVAYLTGSPDLAGTTVNTLQPVL